MVARLFSVVCDLGLPVLRPAVPGEIPQATVVLARKVHSRGTNEMRVRDALGPLFGDEGFTAGVFAGMYPAGGQPGISPALLAMVMVLQFLHNLSDRQAAEAVADRISWKYALGLELEDSGFDYSVLCEFRARLTQHERADALLTVMLARLQEAGLVKAGGRQRTDSTHVIACVRRPSRIEACGETLRAALEGIAAISPAFVARLLREGWEQRYGRTVETSRLLGRKNACARALAEQIGADGREVLDAIDAYPAAAWINTLPPVVALRLVWQQQYEQTRGGRLRLIDPERLAPAADRIHSPHDTDARYSTKGRPHPQPDQEWVGSTCHLSESCDPDTPNLITHVHSTPATGPDVSATTATGDKLIACGLAPDQHLMDAGYPSAGNIAASAQRGITLIAPVIVLTGRNAKQGTFTPADFIIDWERASAICPAGATSRSMRPDLRGLVTFSFSRRTCTRARSAPGAPQPHRRWCAASPCTPGRSAKPG